MERRPVPEPEQRRQRPPPPPAPHPPPKGLENRCQIVETLRRGVRLCKNSISRCNIPTRMVYLGSARSGCIWMTVAR